MSSKILIPPTLYPTGGRGGAEDREAWERDVSDTIFTRTDAFGWLNVARNWAYVSATEISTEDWGDLRSFLEPGTKIRFKQNDDTDFTYGYVVEVTPTNLTLLFDTNNGMADAELGEVSFSRDMSPVGFPGSGTFFSEIAPVSPLVVDAGPGNGAFGRFCIRDRWIDITYGLEFDVTTTGTSFEISLPIEALSVSAQGMAGYGFALTGSTYSALAVHLPFTSSDALITVLGSSFTSPNTYAVQLGLSYPI